MDLLPFLCLALFGYAAGMVGSVAAAYRFAEANKTPGGWEVFVFVAFWMVITSPALQALKVAFALAVAYGAQDTLGYGLIAYLSTGIFCAAGAAALVFSLPALLRKK